MAYGRPVVVTAVGGLVDVTGVLVPPGDIGRLREVLDELLADADWRAHLGAQARERAENALSPGRAGAALRAAYDAAISR
jgi:glycosyltransferase involved in cell wall biosynthesis